MTSASAKHLASSQQGQAQASTHPRYHGLDLVKAVAILAIAAHHFQQDFGAHYAYLNFYDGRLYVGYVVELFFMISGFVLVLSERRRSQTAVVKPFLHRLKRLWPMAAVSVLVAAALWPVYHHFAGIWWDHVPLRPLTFFVSLTTVSQGAFFNSYSYNNPLWYVGVLILCYAIFYVLRGIASRLKIPVWPLFLAMCLLGAYAQIIELDVPFLRFNSSARGYAAFFLGVLLSPIPERLRGKRLSWLASLAAAIVAVGAFGTLVLSDEALQWEWPIDTFVLWPAVLMLFTVSQAAERASDNSFVGLLGRINYELYVWHEVLNISIATVCAACAFPIPSSRLDLLIYLVVCEFVAALFFYAVERPLYKLLDRRRG